MPVLMKVRRTRVVKTKTQKVVRHSKAISKPAKEKNIPWREAFKEQIEKIGEGALALKGARHREGLTQIQLAEKIGIPQRHLSEMENGKRPIGKKMAIRFAAVLGVDYRVFL